MKAQLNVFEEDQARYDITEIEVEFTLDAIMKAIAEISEDMENEEYGCFDSYGIELEVKDGNDYYCEHIFNGGEQEFNEISDKMRILKDVREAFGPNSAKVNSNAIYIGVDQYRFYVVYKENEKVVYLNDQTPYNGRFGMHGKHSKNVEHDEIVPYLVELVNKD